MRGGCGGWGRVRGGACEMTRGDAAGAGSYSFVRRAVQKSSGREVAVKCVSKVRARAARMWYRLCVLPDGCGGGVRSPVTVCVT